MSLDCLVLASQSPLPGTNIPLELLSRPGFRIKSKLTKHTSNMPGTCHLVRKKLQCITDLLATNDFSVSSCFLTQVKASRDETRTKRQKLLASQLNFTWKIPGNICHE